MSTHEDDKNKDRYYHHKIYHKVLRHWYGEKDGRTEMISYCPDSQPIGNLLDGIMEKAMPEDSLKLMKLKNNWSVCVGIQLAKICEPVGITDGIIDIEVNHPAWIRELNGPVKKKLLENIARECGEGFCRELRFVPLGRNRK